ncbi:MAG: hypothetical protein ABL917_00565 [Parcubacteria group bacterium]
MKMLVLTVVVGFIDKAGKLTETRPSTDQFEVDENDLLPPQIEQKIELVRRGFPRFACKGKANVLSVSHFII